MKELNLVHKSGEIILDQNSSKKQLKLFENKLNNGYWLIRFHATWCGHCINMIDEWDKFLSECKKKKYLSYLNIASIESEIQLTLIKNLKNNPNKRSLIECEGFPTIRLIKNGEIISEFTNKERNSKNLIEFIKEHINFLEKKKQSPKSLKSIVKKSLKKLTIKKENKKRK